MAKLDGAMLVAKALKKEGVEKIFTLSGGHTYRIFQECAKLGMDIIDSRSEAECGFAANGYAVTSGKPAVIVATAGPGVTNLFSNVVDANMGDLPILYIGGAAAQMHDLYEVTQQYDQLGRMMEPNTRWAYRVEETSRIPEYIATAFRNMLGCNPGPAYVEIPMDILEINLVEESEVIFPYRYRTDARILADKEYVEKAADLLISAEKPAMIVGNGAQFRCKNKGVFKELAQYLQMPAEAGNNNTGVFFTHEDPLFQIGGLALMEADVILSFNHRPEHAALDFMNRTAKMISVHHNWHAVGLNGPVEIGMIGDSDAICEQILECVKSKIEKRTVNPNVEKLLEKRAEIKKALEDGPWSDSREPMHPGAAAYQVNKWAMTEKGKKFDLVNEGGDTGCWGRQAQSFLVDVDRPHRYFSCNYGGALGEGNGAILGKYEADGMPILHFVGDGSWAEDLSAMYTYAKFKIPYIGVIGNNANMGMIAAFSMEQVPDEDYNIGQLTGPENDGRFHYEAIAATWGGYGKCVTKAEDLPAALDEAYETAIQGIPAIINCEFAFNREVVSAGSIGLYKQLSIPGHVNFEKGHPEY